MLAVRNSEDMMTGHDGLRLQFHGDLKFAVCYRRNLVTEDNCTVKATMT